MGCGALGMLGLLVSLTTSSRDIGPHLAAPETPASPATAEAAPDFALATASGWHSFREVHEDAPVVLVFGADEGALVALEESRPALAARGVEIAAVTRDSDGANWERIERLGLRYALWSDPRGRLAGLFGLGAGEAGWCRIDGRGRIAERRQGVPLPELAAGIERSLGTSESAGSDEMR